jgi:hypothetical protein
LGELYGFASPIADQKLVERFLRVPMAFASELTEQPSAPDDFNSRELKFEPKAMRHEYQH